MNKERLLKVVSFLRDDKNFKNRKYNHRVINIKVSPGSPRGKEGDVLGDLPMIFPNDFSYYDFGDSTPQYLPFLKKEKEKAQTIGVKDHASEFFRQVDYFFNLNKDETTYLFDDDAFAPNIGPPPLSQRREDIAEHIYKFTLKKEFIQISEKLWDYGFSVKLKNNELTAISSSVTILSRDFDTFIVKIEDSFYKKITKTKLFNLLELILE